MEFINECNCVFEKEVLENSIIEECNRRNIIPKDNYKIYMHRGYAVISLKHDKVDIHRIIGKYIVGFNFSSNIVVHHIDKNKLNDLVENLQVIKSELHTKNHYIVQYADKEKLKENALLGTEKIKRNDITKEEVLKLRNQGKTYPQIAKILHCGYNTVWRRIFD